MTSDLETQQLNNMMAASASSQELTGPQGSGVGWLLNWLGDSNGLIAPWWSMQRDIELRTFWRDCDYLAGAIYAMVARIITLPFRVLPYDPTIELHVRQAEEFTSQLVASTEWYRGWNVGMARFLIDHLTQDNGGFLEVIGEGAPDGPIMGRFLGVVHRDSAKCQRTSDPRFPVIYRLDRGEAYKLHHTRVIEYSSMPSPDSRMNYVGFCSVSRCLNIARNLLDIMIFEQEKMGSRPPRTVLVGSKIGTKQLSEAFQMANEVMDAQGLKRFAKTILIGNPDEDINLSMLDLAAVPDGFDKDASVKIGVAAIALALGIDFRELWPATVTGATKADASIQHLKAKGKGFGEIIQMIERLFGRKVLPAHLYLKFDYQDDEEDSLRAEIRRTRSESYKNNLESTAVTQRIVHEWMLENGELNEVQFEQVELENGRLPDGAPVLTLFATSDPDFRLLLDLGVSDPVDVKTNNPLTMMDAISAQYAKVESVYINTPRKRIKSMARQSMAALKELFKLYMSGIQVGRPYLLEEQQEAEQESNSDSDNESDGNGAGSREGKPAGREGERSPTSPPTQH